MQISLRAIAAFPNLKAGEAIVALFSNPAEGLPG
jgi:hypothetical protein